MNATQEKPNILVVDDEPVNVKILAAALGKDYKVIVAKSGSEALALAKRNQRPDLILLDIMMPEMDGYEVCRHLKTDSNTENIPVIFISAMNQTADESKGFDLGAVDYITKPIRLPILRNRVRTHLDLKKYRDRLEHQVEEKTHEVHKALKELTHVHEQVKSGYLDAIYRLTLASEYKDPETGEHIKTKNISMPYSMLRPCTIWARSVSRTAFSSNPGNLPRRSGLSCKATRPSAATYSPSPTRPTCRWPEK